MPSSKNKAAVGQLSHGGSGVAVVLFDYGQVLSTPPDPVAWSRMQAIMALSDARLHEAYWKFRHDYDRDALNGRAYWGAVARHTGVEVSEKQIRELMVADVDLWTQPNLPMIAWAGRLQLAGVRTAILSNIGDAIAEGIVARLKWLNGFERCVWSYALQVAKPDVEIFRMTAEMLAVAPERGLFIDDKEENVAAARRVGFQAIRYTTQGEFEREMRADHFGSLLDVSAANTAP